MGRVMENSSGSMPIAFFMSRNEALSSFVEFDFFACT